MRSAKTLPPAVPQDDWLAEQLSDPELAAEYLNAVLAEGDQATFMRALRNVAKARPGGVSALAKETGLNRVSLNRALSETGNPEFRSFTAVLAASGLSLAIRPTKENAVRRRNLKVERSSKAA